MAVSWRLFASPFDHNDDDNEKEFTGKEGGKAVFSAPTDGRMDDSPSHPATVTRQFSLQPATFLPPSYQTVTFCRVLHVVGGWTGVDNLRT